MSRRGKFKINKDVVEKAKKDDLEVEELSTAVGMMGGSSTNRSTLGGGSQTNRDRVGSYRLVTGRDDRLTSRNSARERNSSRASSRTDRQSSRTDRQSSRNARGRNCFAGLDPIKFVRCAMEASELMFITQGGQSQDIDAALEATRSQQHKCARINFNKLPYQIAHLFLNSQTHMAVVQQALMLVPKVQTNLVNVNTVMCVGGGPCTDALAIANFIVQQSELRHVPMSSLLIRVLDPEPQWEPTWNQTFDQLEMDGIVFEPRDYDGMKLSDTGDWSIPRVDLFSFSFVVKPVFMALWSEAATVIQNLIDLSKEGSFWLWVNHSDSPMNPKFDKWMENKGMLLQYEFEGLMSELDITVTQSPLLNDFRERFGHEKGATDLSVFIRIYRKPKKGVNLPQMEKSPNTRRRLKGSTKILEGMASDSSSDDDDDDE